MSTSNESKQILDQKIREILSNSRWSEEIARKVQQKKSEVRNRWARAISTAFLSITIMSGGSYYFVTQNSSGHPHMAERESRIQKVQVMVKNSGNSNQGKQAQRLIQARPEVQASLSERHTFTMPYLNHLIKTVYQP